MTFEEEIKQKEFKSQFQKASLNLIFTSSWLGHKNNQLFKSYSLSTQQYNVLRILKGQYPKVISTSDIKQRMLDKNSDVSRIVDRLYLKKLVEKKNCPNDKRLVDIYLSQKGIELLSSMQDKVDMLTNSLGSLTSDEALTLNTLLDKIRE